MKNKIAYKLIFYIFFISLIITSISIYFQINNIYNNQLNELEKDLQTIKKNQLPVLSQALWNIDNSTVNIVLESLLNDKRITYTKLVEEDGKTIEFGSYQEENSIKKNFSVTKKIKDNNRILGKLYITVDLNPLHKELKQYAITTILTEFIKIFFIAFLIIFIIRQLLTNNLEKMANYAKQLTLDNLNKPLSIKSDSTNTNQNELDIVCDSVNTMRVNLLEQLQKSRQKDHILAHQSKMAAMGEMIGNIAHQWRQPLSVISTTSTGIKFQKELGLLKEEDIITSMDTITKSAKYLSSTIDDFRDFFKPTKEKTYFNIDDAINKALSIISHQYYNHSITIFKNIESISIYGFENELVQVLINILNNAKDALVAQKQKDNLVFIDVNLENQNVVIKIKDNARGIPQDTLSRVFEPYFTTKDQSQGTGIGLYICEEVIKKHMNGSIYVNNTTYDYNQQTYTGAEFSILLSYTKETNTNV